MDFESCNVVRLTFARAINQRRRLQRVRRSSSRSHEFPKVDADGFGTGPTVGGENDDGAIANKPKTSFGQGIGIWRLRDRRLVESHCIHGNRLDGVVGIDGGIGLFDVGDKLEAESCKLRPG